MVQTHSSSSDDFSMHSSPEFLARELAAIVESSEDAILSKTLDGIITSWNAGAEQMYGYTAEEVVGKHVSMLVPPELPDEIPSIMARLRKGERIELYETTRMRKNGERFVVSLRVSPIRDETGRVVGASAIARDITHLKQIEQERERLLREEQAARQRAEAIRARLELLAGVGLALSHSLDYETSVQNLTRLLVPRFADQCIVDLLNEDRVERVAVAATSPEHEAALRQLVERYPPDPKGLASRHAIEARATLFVSEMTDDFLRSVAVDDEHFELIRSAGVTSLIVVPLIARQQPIGSLSLAMSNSGRVFTQDDVLVAESLARRAGLALENVRLYQEAQVEIERRRDAEQQLRLITDAMPALISYITKDCRYRFTNKEYEEWFGLPSSEMPGKHVREVIGEKAYETLKEYFERVLAGETIDHETLVDFQHTGMRYIHGQYIPDVGPDGKVRGFFALVRDVSERRRSEQQLGEALARMTDLYRVSRQIGTVKSASAVLEALVSSRALGDANRATIGVFSEPWGDQPPKMLQIVADWRRDPSAPDDTGKYYRVEGSELATLWSPDKPLVLPDIQVDPRAAELEAQAGRLGFRSGVFFPLTASGQWFGIFGIFFDRPQPLGEEDVRHMQGLVDQAASAIYNIGLLRSEAAARREAERANELKMQFLAMISHELRTPLTSIQGFASTLLADDVTWDPSEQREFIQIINQESERLTDLVEQLLDLSRLEAGMLRIEPERVKLDELVSSSSASLQVITAEHDLVLDIPADLPEVYVDGKRIMQVLNNLVTNAARYSPKGTCIEVRAVQEGSSIRVTVRDQGPGIPAEEREAVFEAFRQATNRPGNEDKGAGLGLAIARGLIMAHGGRIWVEDTGEQGTTMAFTLPISHGQGEEG